MTTYISPFDENMRETFQKTAEHLTGRVVILRFCEPLARGANGECYKSDDGITRINISPGLSIQAAYNIALHEIAHARLNHAAAPMTASQYQLTATADARKVNRQPANKAQHSEADALADQWIEWAHAQVKHLIRWNTTEADRAVMNMAALSIKP